MSTNSENRHDHAGNNPSRRSSRPKPLKRCFNLVGPQISRLRAANCWTQTDLAEKLQQEGVWKRQSDVAKIETGRTYVSDLQLLVLAKVFNVAVERIFPPACFGKNISRVQPDSGSKSVRRNNPAS